MGKQRAAGGQGFLAGTLILSAATAAVKVFGFVYKIPIQNLLGPAASGYFTAAYDVFAALFVLSTAGLPVAVSALVSEARAVGGAKQAARTLRVSLAVFCALGVLGTLALCLGAGHIAALGRSPHIAPALRIVGPSMLLICITGAFRGYHQGHGDMAPTAVSQTLEAAVKAALGLALAYAAASLGAPDEIKAAAAMGGVTAGSLAAVVYMVFTRRRRAAREPSGLHEKTRPVLRRLLQIAIPATLSAMAVNLASLIDTLTINARLIGGAGFSSAKAEYCFGAYSYARTLFGVAPSFMLAMAVSVIPAVAARRARRDSEGEANVITSGLRLAALFSLPAASGLYFLAQPILNLLYGRHGQAVAVAEPLMEILGVATVFVCLVSVTNAMLQARGQAMLPVLTMLAGAAVKLIVSMTLVGRPEINILGAPIGTLACYAAIAGLNLWALARTVGIRPVLGVFPGPLAAAVLMGWMCRGFYGFAAHLLNGPKAFPIAALTAVTLGAASYAALAVLFRAVKREDLEWLPKGDRLAALLKIY